MANKIDEHVGTTYCTAKGGVLTVLPWSGEKRGSHKYYPVECSICSEDSELFPEPFLCKKSDTKKGIVPCACGSFNWKPWHHEVRIERYFKETHPYYSLVGWGFPWKGYRSKPMIYCSIHKTTSVRSNITHILRGEVLCCNECARDSYVKHYSLTEAQALSRIHEHMGNVGGKFNSFVDRYVGLQTYIKWQCKNGHHPSTKLEGLIVSGNDCFMCKENGFRDYKKGYFYVTEFIKEGKDDWYSHIKFGITNKDPRTRNKEQTVNTTYKEHPIAFILFEHGGDARYLEKCIMDIYPTGVVTKADFPAGYTETLDADVYTKYDLWGDLIALTGCSIFNELVQDKNKDRYELEFKEDFNIVDTRTLERVGIYYD